MGPTGTESHRGESNPVSGRQNSGAKILQNLYFSLFDSVPLILQKDTFMVRRKALILNQLLDFSGWSVSQVY